jgi:predicted dehydrogenase
MRSARMTASEQIRYAIVGLGYISQVAMLPAFRNARRNSKLAALVSGDREKLQILGRRYHVGTLATYDEYDALLHSGEIDAVYIGLPNTLHAEYACRAAEAGVHVLCDKPLATTVAECEAMLRAAERVDVQLMTAYRLQFEPGNLATFDTLRGGKLGDLRYFTAQFSMQVKPGNIRTQGELGGGPLYDLGVYCINAARHVFQAEPIEVFAATAQPPATDLSGTKRKVTDKRFAEIEEMAAVTLRFPDDALASFICSFGAAEASAFQVWGSKGSLRLDEAFEMVGTKKLSVDLSGAARPSKRTQSFPATDQFAPLLLHFSDCILHRRGVIPSGAEGMADIRVVEAIQQSAQRNAPVSLAPAEFAGAELTARRAMEEKPHGKPELFKAAGPH